MNVNDQPLVTIARKMCLRQWTTALATAASFVYAAPALATSYAVSPENSSVKFEAVGRPSLMKIKGSGAKISGKLNIVDDKMTGHFEIALADFDTGISLRNEHMRDKYLEVKKYPNASVDVKEIILPKDWQQSKKVNLDFTGTLKLKDQQGAITGQLTINGKEKQGEVDFSFKLSDYKVGIPSYMGITVADLVTIHGEAQIKEVVMP